MKKLRIATVFSGIGALEWAAKRLSIPHELVFACDNGEREIDFDLQKAKEEISEFPSLDEKAAYQRALYSSRTKKINQVEKIYLQNYGDLVNEGRFFQDIRLLDGSLFRGKVDLLMGGSPCQSFSTVGKQLGFEDTRGTLFYEFARIVKEVEPSVFIYENVKGLTTNNEGKTFETILRVFREEFDYDVSYSLLDATEFNIPQRRTRVLVVGTKKRVGFDVAKIKRHVLAWNMQDFLEDHCAEGNFTIGKNGKIHLTPQPGRPDPRSILTPAVTRYVTKSGTKSWHMKPEMDRPIARTLLKTMGNHHRAGVDNYITIDAERGIYRALTPRECFRLMGFTDEFNIEGIPWNHLYMQAGNSVVVDMLISVIVGLMDCKAF